MEEAEREERKVPPTKAPGPGPRRTPLTKGPRVGGGGGVPAPRDTRRERAGRDRNTAGGRRPDPLPSAPLRTPPGSERGWASPLLTAWASGEGGSIGEKRWSDGHAIRNPTLFFICQPPPPPSPIVALKIQQSHTEKVPKTSVERRGIKAPPTEVTRTNVRKVRCPNSCHRMFEAHLSKVAKLLIRNCKS